jgi:hypothetical protein
MNRTWRDAITAVLAVQFGMNGLWALAAPRSFYDSFPGAGRVWVGVDGPYNEHLMRDVGALLTALAVLNAYAFINRSAPATRAAGLGIAVFSAPHVVYHAATADLLPVGDAIANVASLALGLALGLALAISPRPPSQHQEQQTHRLPSRDSTPPVSAHTTQPTKAAP